jgi:hypothetical protein
MLAMYVATAMDLGGNKMAGTVFAWVDVNTKFIKIHPGQNKSTMDGMALSS